MNDLEMLLNPEINLKDIKLPLIPSPIDERDHTIMNYAAAYMGIDISMADYPGIEPEIFNQGSSMMCAAFTLTSAKYLHEFVERKERIRFSPAYVYANRVSKEYNSEGMILRNAISDLRSFGTVRYEDFPGIGTYPELRAKLDQRAAALLPLGLAQRIKSYFQLTNVSDIKRAIVRDTCVAAGYMLYTSFMKPLIVDGLKGVIPMPLIGDKVEGGHAVLITGWKMINNKLHWKIANSWGSAWGDRGFCYIPADYSGYSEMWAMTDATPEPFVATTIAMQLDNPKVAIYRNGGVESVILDSPPVAVKGRTMLPAKFISELFGYKAKWFPTTREVYLTNNEPDLPAEISGDFGSPLE